jgi:hypothetical protein
MNKQELAKLMKERDPLKTRQVVEPVDLYQVPSSEQKQEAPQQVVKHSRKQESLESQSLGLSDPRQLEIDPSEGRVSLGTLIYPTRKRQLEFERYLTGDPEWKIIDRALDMYFKAKRTNDETR